jgi:hypothetical protein
MKIQARVLLHKTPRLYFIYILALEILQKRP